MKEVKRITIIDSLVVVQDLATQLLQSYPCKTKTSQETQKCMQKFSQIRNKWSAERAVRRVKEGTSAELLQPCLDANWWAGSMECFTYPRNIQDLLSDGKTPYGRRFGMPLNGPVRAMVEYHPISAKDQSRLHQCGKKVLLEYSSVMYCTREGTWKGDIMVADIEELEEMDASELHARGLNAKEVLMPMKGDKFSFPSCSWNSQHLRGGTASENIHLNLGTS